MSRLATFLSLLALAVALPSELATRTPFENQCRRMAIRDSGKTGLTTLVGQCIDDAGVWYDTELNLNFCMSSVDGQLTYEADGYFDEFCHPCLISEIDSSTDMMLKCNCVTDDGLKIFTEIQMGHGVADPLAVKAEGGRFVCGETEGLKEVYGA